MYGSFRLSRRKNQFRKARKRAVSIEHGSVTSVVSIEPVHASREEPEGIPITQLTICHDSADACTSTTQPQACHDDLIVTVPITFLADCEVFSVIKLREWMKALSILPHGWVDASSGDRHVLTLAKVESVDGIAHVKLGVEITGDLAWSLLIGVKRIESNTKPLVGLPQMLTSVSTVRVVIEQLESLAFCKGNEDDKYFPVQEARKGVFKDPSGCSVATYVKDHFDYKTIRCTSCHIIVPLTDSRCDPCKSYRKILNSMLSRQQKNSDASPSRSDSHANFRFLNTPQRKKRIGSLRMNVKVNQLRVKRLRERLEKVIEERGLEVDVALHEELKETVREKTSEITSHYPPDSFQRIFWEQQQQSMEKKDARSMRWEPAMIRWCLYLRHLSGSAYEVLRSSGVLTLPCQRTLRDYTYHTRSVPGFSGDVDRDLIDTASLQSCAERERHVIIILDEMHVRENLVYDKHTGSIIGFTHLGEVNAELAAYEKSLEEDSVTHEPLANSMLVVMVRGLFSKMQFPYAQFPCTKLRGYELYDIFWEAVERLERCGFIVLACTCDGLSVNRSFFKLHGSGERVYKVINPYSQDKRYLFFISDPPHLIKTVRNSWHSSKRLLWNDGKHILWSHLADLYMKCRSNEITPGLTIVPRLKYEHIHLSNFSKMRVDLAAQVLSNSVGKALKTMQLPEVEKTAEFALFFNKLFDCLNVSNLSAGQHSRNAFIAPYHSASDFRIKWLKEDFLGYLDKWDKSVNERTGFTGTQKEKMLISRPTREGLRITVLSFIDLVTYVFTIPGVKVFLSNRICQDPLENFFGRQRQRGRVNENPSTAEFLKNTQALRVINSTTSTVRGNCRGTHKRDQPIAVDNSEIKKRKTKHK